MNTISKNGGPLFIIVGLALSAYAEYRRRAVVGGLDSLYWIITAVGLALAVFFMYRILKDKEQQRKAEAEKAGASFKEKDDTQLLSNALIYVGVAALFIGFLVSTAISSKSETAKAATEGAELLFRLR